MLVFRFSLLIINNLFTVLAVYLCHLNVIRYFFKHHMHRLLAIIFHRVFLTFFFVYIGIHYDIVAVLAENVLYLYENWKS